MSLAQGPQHCDAGEARVAAPQSQVKHSTTESLRLLNYECSVIIITCASTLALSTSVLESAISPLTAQPKHKKIKNSIANSLQGRPCILYAFLSSDLLQINLFKIFF